MVDCLAPDMPGGRVLSSPKTLLRALVQRWWLLLAGAVLAMAASYLAFRFLTPWPRYQAKAIAMVRDRTGDSDWASLQASRALASTYALWVTQQPVLEGAIHELDLPVSSAELRQDIAARAIGNTELIEVSAMSRDAEQAADIANELVRQLEAQIAVASTDETALPPPSREEIVELEGRISDAGAELTRLTEQLSRHEIGSPVAGDIAQREAQIRVAEAELQRLIEALATYELSVPEISEIAQLETLDDRTESRLTLLTEQLLADGPRDDTDVLAGQVDVLQGNLGLWQSRLDGLYAKARADSEAELSQIVRRINVTQSYLEMWQRQVDRLYARAESASEAELDQLVRRINVLQSNLSVWRGEYNDLMGRYADRPAVSLVVIEKAEPPPSVVSPLPNILIAGASGLVLAMGVVLFLEMRPGAFHFSNLGSGWRMAFQGEEGKGEQRMWARDEVEPQSLLGRLHSLPDPRRREARVYPMPGLIAMLVMAAAAGESSLSGMWRWAVEHWQTIGDRLGFGDVERPPALTTVRKVLGKVDGGELDNVFAEWSGQELAAGEDMVAIDGKTLHGSRRYAQTVLQVVTAAGQEVKKVVAQSQVEKGDWEAAALDVLTRMSLEGKVVTMDDAGLLQRSVAQMVVKKGEPI